MTKIGAQEMTTAQLIARYVALLLGQYEERARSTAQQDPDLRSWDEIAADIVSVYRTLRSRDGGVASLLPLLRHENPNVRYSAALHLLESSEKDALPILNEMARATELPTYTGDLKRALRKALESRWISDQLLSTDRVGILGMSQDQLSKMGTSQLIDRFVGLLLEQYAVRDRHDANTRRDVGPWNRLADQINMVEREIKSRGGEGVDALLTLTRHPNPNVRYAASVQCLRQRTAQVLPILEEMARTNDFRETRIDPAGALARWRGGKWVVS